MNTPIPMQCNTFYEQIKTCPNLDLRDPRGKIHCLAFVLLGVIISLSRNRDGVLSSIHRSMVNTHKALCTHMKLDGLFVVSRAQLPLILKKLDVDIFNELIMSFFGIKLTDNQKEWFASDGKELRGSILKGDTRGEAVVQIVGHKNRIVYKQGFYNGKKESERPCVSQLLDDEIGSQKITLDALHLIPETVKKIEKQKGVFVIGVKENQQELLEDMKMITSKDKPVAQHSDTEKSNGRIDTRAYMGFTLKNSYFDQRWQDANFQTVIKVERHSYNCKNKTESNEMSYYISNQKLKQDGTDNELFNAIRGHWNVETNNHIRDVTLKEDNLKTKYPTMARNMATCRTGLLNLLYQLNLKNIKAKLEEFADNFQTLLKWLTKCNFL